jgi:hypothetical protein
MKETTGFCIVIARLLTFICLLLPALVSVSNTTILIDFGKNDVSDNIYELPGWSNMILSSNMQFSTNGPGGVRVASELDDFTDYMGVSGTPRKFNYGERIVITWYNDSDDIIIFTTRISFTDSDNPDGGLVEGSWFTCRSFDDYRISLVQASPRSICKTVFNIQSSGVHKSDETFNLVNINISIEWGENQFKPFLICDKIELLNDADTTPPDIPTGLNATPISDTKVRLTWSEPYDNTGVVEYLIYMDGNIEGYSRETSYTVNYLQPEKSYNFSVTALDHCRNESVKSTPVSTATHSFLHGNTVINPKGFEYLGAFRFPESVNWGGESFTYNPQGDGGQSNNSDNHPGSLFISNLNQEESGFIGEFTIPTPLKGVPFEDLNIATMIQDFANIRPTNVNAWPYVDLWRSGLCCSLAPGTSDLILFSTWAFNFQVSEEKSASLSACIANNLQASPKLGAWYLGSSSGDPLDVTMNEYLFKAPDDWALENVNGRTLITGKMRQGGLGGLGPTLFAFEPINFSTPPQPEVVLPVTTLLRYGPVSESNNYHFPNSIDAYNHADWWKGGGFLSVNNQKAVILSGQKGLGDNWYGYTGERMLHSWVNADIPIPEFLDSDPFGKGWRAHREIPMLILFDPEYLAEVANGKILSSVPQPYAAIRIDTNILFGIDYELRDAAYDSFNNYYYALEFDRVRDGSLICHVWKINSIVSVDELLANALELEIYPNPSEGIFSVSLPEIFTEIASYALYDTNVKLVESGTLSNYSKHLAFNFSKYNKGVYFLTINTASEKFWGKIIIN